MGSPHIHQEAVAVEEAEVAFNMVGEVISAARHNMVLRRAATMALLRDTMDLS
jgi:hypothetical protein